MIPEHMRLISTSAKIVKMVGPSAAIWLGHAINAQSWVEMSYKESWWYATKVDIEERTGLSAEMQETARKKLRELGILEERRGMLRRGAALATIWYRVDVARLEELCGGESRRSTAGHPGAPLPVAPANDHTLYTSLLTTVAPKPEKPRKATKQPTKEEFIEWAKENYPEDSSSRAESFYDEVVLADWTDGKGKAIKNIKLRFNTFHNSGWLSRFPKTKTTSTARRIPGAFAASFSMEEARND